MMFCEMYENFKDAMGKTIKTELLTDNNNQSADSDLPQRGQIIRFEQELHQHRTKQCKNASWYK